MAGNYKVPPTFDESKPYESWKNEVGIWARVTELEKKKQALAVALALNGRARDTAMEIPVDDLNKDTGMVTLLAKLDDLYLKEEKDRTYEAYTRFDKTMKDASMSMADYIIDFEQRYSRMKKYKMELPDAVLAFKLLDTACLDISDRQLALTACSDLTYSSMKSALKRIFGGKNVAVVNASQETVYVTGQRRQRSKPQWQRNDQQKTLLPGKNPLDKFGRRSKCAVCQSTFHWAKECPHKDEQVQFTQEDDNEIDECNITLFTKESHSESEIFMTESFGSAIIDTACTRTVCGQKWLDSYMAKLDNCKMNATKKTEMYSHRPFKFGDGKVVHSTKRLKIPASIGKTKCLIETEVVPANIPLLLSKASLKRAGTVLDMENDKAMMFNKPVTLEFTSSGHYCVDITDSAEKSTRCADQILTTVDKDSKISTSEEEENLNKNEVLTITDQMSSVDKHKTLLKLHRQFGHATADKLHRLLVSSGCKDIECDALLQKIIRECETCQRHGKAKPKPAVGLPLASQYNETVAVDLHELEPGVWYLHIIDQFTRFSAGSVLTTKKSSEIVKHFFHDWISVHGPPQKLFSDNGGEFNSEEVRDMAENFNIEVKTTAAYSPWSNGLLERHNMTLTEILIKVKTSVGCDWNIAMDWALMAKNTLQNVHGYSPYQLVFGKNPNLPTVLTDTPPALEGTTRSEWVAKHLSALHAARKSFTETECSERIRRALRKQIRPTDEKYEMGNKVYYKRMDCQEWKGPGTVIGQDGAVVFVRHGGTCVRVHRLRLRKVNIPEENQVITGSYAANDKPLAEVQEHPSCNSEEMDEPVARTEDELEAVYEDNADRNDERERENNADRNDERVNVNLKTGQIITYTENGTVHTAKVTGRAGKASGKYKNWYNLLALQPTDIAGNTGSVDISRVEDLQIQTNTTDDSTNECESVLDTKDVSFDQAKNDEVKNWKDNQVFEEVEEKGQTCISTRWVCTIKETANGLIPKARLVARGFEEMQISELQKDSPTCASESLRLLVAVICQKQWKVHSMDIKSAFLQGMELSRDVFIRPPPEANCKGIVWKLKKCVYGLADASLYWYNRVKEIMLQAGGKMSQVDPAVFFWQDDCSVTGVLACHVDDFIWGGTENFCATVIPHLRSVFQVGREAHNCFSYVGMDFLTVNENVQIHQDTYTQNIQPLHVIPLRAVEQDSPLTKEEKDQLRSKVGQILWVARQSRPDVMFDASSLASSINNATVKTINETNRIICKLKSKRVVLNFQHLGGEKALRMVVFSDASFGNLSDGGTQGGHLILLMGESGRFSPLSWKSKRVKRIVRSTLAGETLAMSEAIDDAIFLNTLLTELTTAHTELSIPIICVTDNHSLFDALKSTKSVHEKRLRLEMNSIKEMIQIQHIGRVLWCDTKRQLADCLTKKGASPILLLKALHEGQWQFD